MRAEAKVYNLGKIFGTKQGNQTQNWTALKNLRSLLFPNFCLLLQNPFFWKGDGAIDSIQFCDFSNIF